MSTRTQNIELEKPTSDENYDISVFNRNADKIDQEIALRAKTADIQNNLTSTATNKPLSAAQGKALNDGKVNISDIQNSLTSTATNKPLSAAQGKILSDAIAGKSQIVFELVSGTFSWSAGIHGQNFGSYTKQGYKLIAVTPIGLSRLTTTVFSFSVNHQAEGNVYMTTSSTYDESNATETIGLIWLKNN